MDVCIYLRVSSSVQVDGISLQLQEERLRAYAASQGWTVVERYEDAGLSGSSTDRPAFRRMMEDARKGRFQAILVYKLDRLTRSVRDFHELADELESRGVAIVSVTQNIDTSSPTGRLLRNILIDFANFERELIAERSSEGKRRLAAGGRYLGWHPPLGYRKVGERANARLVIVPEDAQLVRRVFDLYLTGQYGDALIAKMTGLTANRVRRILLNPTYCGKIAYAKRRGKHKHVSRFTIDDWIIVDGDHEPIITEEEFIRALQIRVENSRYAGPKTGSGHLFGGLVLCGKCGMRMVLAGAPGHSRKNYVMYYRCRRRDREHNCEQRPVRHEAIEAVFLRQLQEVLDAPAFWAQAEERWRRRQEKQLQDERAASLKARRAQIVRQIDNLVTALADGEIVAAIRPRLTALERERKEIDEQLRRIEEEGKRQQSTSPTTTRQLMRSVAANWRLMSVEEKREGVRLFVRRIVVNGEELRIEWTDPNLVPTTATLPPKRTRFNL